MAPRSIRKALGAVKDQTSIGLAKVSSSSNAVSDLEVAIVKATRHDENPAEERHIREILSLTCYSRQYVTTCVQLLSRRLGKTRSWAVALKTLVLVHRLLLEGDPAYEQEVFFATRRGTRMLNMCDFRDNSSKSAGAWDLSAFVRTFALYLDERLEYRMQGRRNGHNRRGTASARSHTITLGSAGDDEDDPDEAATGRASSASSSSRALTTPIRELRTDRIFNRTQHLQQLLERFLACRPTGVAKTNRVVAVAMYPLVRESYQLYYDLTEITGVLVDRFMELEVADCVRVHEIFTRAAKQFDELERFYQWCKSVGIARSTEYPEVEKVTQKRLDVMDELIRERSALAARSRGPRSIESPPEPEEEKPEEETYDDMNGVKALPAPEPEEEKQEEEPEPEPKPEPQPEEEVDFLNLRDDAVSHVDHGERLALALFDGGMGVKADTAQPPPGSNWESFVDEQEDWETALVLSTSYLPHQKPTLAGGFDVLMLDGMYQQPLPLPGGRGLAACTGSASSVAFPAPGQPHMLALPAPPPKEGDEAGKPPNADPFAASMMVPAPPYVQISDMGKKQQLLVQEQVMWQHYTSDGMQGESTLARVQQQQELRLQQQLQHRY